MNIDKFIANISEGLASPSRYNIIFPNGDESLTMMCNTSSLPSRNFLTSNNQHYNNKFKLPISNVFQDVTFSFINTKGLPQKLFFDNWLNDVIDNNTGLIKFYDDYVKDITIEHLDKLDGSVDYAIKLINAYPLDAPQINMGYSMLNEVIISTVTFTFEKWVNV